jgi:hypothetical protein
MNMKKKMKLGASISDFSEVVGMVVVGKHARRWLAPLVWWTPPSTSSPPLLILHTILVASLTTTTSELHK